MKRIVPGSLFIGSLLIAACLVGRHLCVPAALALDAKKDSGNKTPIKIGFLAPLSGPGAADGARLVDGFKLFLDQHGNKIAGRPVELKVEDDEGHVSVAAGKARKLIQQDKVDLLSGVVYTPLAYAVAPVADELHAPFVISVSAADDLTQRKRYHWVVRPSFSASQISQPFGEYVAKKLHYKKVVAIGSAYGHPYEIVAGFQKTFEENGGEIIQKFWVSNDQEDFSGMIKKISPDADCVLLCLVAKPAETLPKQLRQAWPKMPIIGCTTSFEEGILPEIGPYVDGAISSHFYSSALDTSQNKKFVSEYRAKYHEDPSGMYSQNGYTSAMWIDRAVQAVGGDVEDKDKLLTALKNVQLPESVRGPLKMDSYNCVVQNVYIRKVEKVGGKYQNTVIFTYPMVSQFWKTKPEEFLKQPVFSKDYPPCTHCLK